MNIIPAPQKVEIKPGRKVDWGKFTRREIYGLSPETLEFVKKDFPGKWELSKKKGFHARLAKPSAKEPPVKVPEKIDAYVLRVTSDGVFIDANDSAGLWHGLQTLAQITGEAEKIPLCEIADHAAIRGRGVHWDLKGFQPKFPVLLEQFRRMARYKINMVLLEIEDKFDYRDAPGAGVPGAYTHEQFRELSRHAAALGIIVVPKVQCIAHVDYLLKHSRYRHLRELEHPYQYCPRSDEVFALWKAMAGEIMECFQEHREFFHIGADEADKLGKCPKCSKYSRAESYIFHVDRCLDFVIEQGRTPIIWDDMLRDPYNDLGKEGEGARLWKLSKKAVLNYWSYGYGGRNNVFPYISQYKEYGARVWGASCFSGVDNWAGCLPSLEIRSKNIDAWTKTALENNLEAVIATGWSRIASGTSPVDPKETSWFTFAYAAESMWTGKSRELSDFADALSMQLHRRHLPRFLRDAVLNIVKNPVSMREVEYDFDDNPSLALLQHAAVAESFASSLNMLDIGRRMFHGQLGNVLPDYIVDSRRGIAKKLLDDMDKLEAGLRKWMGEFYEESSVDDFIRARLAYCRENAKDFLRLLDKTKLQ